MNNILKQVRGSWKSVLWGMLPVAVVAIVFAIPLKAVAVQSIETYWETETISEPYTVTESYIDTEPYIATETRTETIYNSYIYPGKTHTFEVDKPGTTVSVNVQGYPYTYYPQYYVVYSDDENPYYQFWPYQYWGGQNKMIIEVSYPEEVTKYRTVTKYKDVTKYREVPTQVLKERAVTEYVKMSIWGYLFMDQKR